MKLTFLGAAQTVTGSKYFLEEEDCRILVDCGLFQGKKELRLRNWEEPPFVPREVDAALLTHAHLDHSGYLPLLVKKGFRGPIYATPATKELAEILLRDSGRIQEEDAERANRHGYSKHRPALPLYREEDAVRALKQFKTLEFGEELRIKKGLSASARRAGHLLGAMILSIECGGKKLVFSGDLGRSKDFFMQAPERVERADYLILESTYGDRRHPEEDPLEKLEKIIRSTEARGGTILIPSFAVGRTQTVLYLLHKLKTQKRIPPLPIYLDSPMAQDATDLMCRHLSEHRLKSSECHAVCQTAEYLRSPEESKQLNDLKTPAIILSASGMIEGGRVLHHVKRLAPEEKNSLVFTGFQAPMTRGDRILRGEPEVKIHGQSVPIRCRVEYLESLSSHADYEELLDWLKGFKNSPRVFLTHGEPDSARALKARIEERMGWEVEIPSYRETVSL